MEEDLNFLVENNFNDASLLDFLTEFKKLSIVEQKFTTYNVMGKYYSYVGLMNYIADLFYIVRSKEYDQRQSELYHGNNTTPYSNWDSWNNPKSIDEISNLNEKGANWSEFMNLYNSDFNMSLDKFLSNKYNTTSNLLDSDASIYNINQVDPTSKPNYNLLALFDKKSDFGYKDKATALIDAAVVLDFLGKQYKLFEWASKNQVISKEDLTKLMHAVAELVNADKSYNNEQDRSKKTKKAKELVDKYVDLVTNWVKVFHDSLTEDGKYNDKSNTLNAYITQNVDTLTLNLKKAEDGFCSRDPNQAFCSMKRVKETKPKGIVGVLNKVVENKRQHISLDALWNTWCMSKNPEFSDSLFCAVGWGNPVALLIMRMRFVLPVNPSKHILNSIKASAKGTLAESTVDKFFAKINNREVFKWSDFSPLVQLLDVSGPGKAAVEKLMKNYGVTTAPLKDGEATSAASRNNTKAKAAVGEKTVFPKTSYKELSLDTLYSEKCLPRPNGQAGPWNESLFCEIGNNDVSANYLGRFRFVIPDDPNNHAILQLLQIIKNALQGDKENQQTWTQYGILAAIERQTDDIIYKIKNNQLITWEDLRRIFIFSTGFGLGLIGINLVEADLSSLMETVVQGANGAIKSMGLQFAE